MAQRRFMSQRSCPITPRREAPSTARTAISRAPSIETRSRASMASSVNTKRSGAGPSCAPEPTEVTSHEDMSHVGDWLACRRDG